LFLKQVEKKKKKPSLEKKKRAKCIFPRKQPKKELKDFGTKKT